MTPRRAHRLARCEYYSENATPKSSAVCAGVHSGVRRDFYAQERELPASSRFHKYGSICASKSGWRAGPCGRFAVRFARPTRRLCRRLHKWGMGKEYNSSLKLLTPDPCVLTPNFSCRFVSGVISPERVARAAKRSLEGCPIRDRVARQADRPITEKRRWRRRMPPGHAAVRRD